MRHGGREGEREGGTEGGREGVNKAWSKGKVEGLSYQTFILPFANSNIINKYHRKG